MLDKSQEVFEKVLNHLGRQKRRAVEGLVCVYKAGNGDKCAIGCLIPDEEYKPSFETQPIGTILDEIPTLKDANLRLLQTLQHLHDSSFFWNWYSYNPNHSFSIDGIKKIQDIAHAYNLKIPEAYVHTSPIEECANE